MFSKSHPDPVNFDEENQQIAEKRMKRSDPDSIFGINK
jgi:hypothetical protein